MVNLSKKNQWIIFYITLFILIFIEFFYDEKWLYFDKDLHGKNNNSYESCFIYQDKRHLKNTSYDIIYNKLGKDIYNRQRRLTITESGSKIVIYGHTLGVFRELFAFGGGGAVLVFDKKGNCIELKKYLTEK